MQVVKFKFTREMIKCVIKKGMYKKSVLFCNFTSMLIAKKYKFINVIFKQNFLYFTQIKV